MQRLLSSNVFRTGRMCTVSVAVEHLNLPIHAVLQNMELSEELQLAAEPPAPPKRFKYCGEARTGVLVFRFPFETLKFSERHLAL